MAVVAGRSTGSLAVRKRTASMTHTFIRSAAEVDLAAVGDLLQLYMAESLGRTWEGSPQALARDIGAGRVRLTIAEADADLVALASWYPVYDVHHCAIGGEISDLFVLPRFRGRGLAPRLIAHVAREIEAFGGRFVKGRGADSGGGLSSRIAVICNGGECYVGGGAFRALAALADASPRIFAARLPDRERNFEQ